jgi:hypothetical protein
VCVCVCGWEGGEEHVCVRACARACVSVCVSHVCVSGPYVFVCVCVCQIRGCVLMCPWVYALNLNFLFKV